MSAGMVHSNQAQVGLIYIEAGNWAKVIRNKCLTTERTSDINRIEYQNLVNPIDSSTKLHSQSISRDGGRSKYSKKNIKQKDNNKMWNAFLKLSLCDYIAVYFAIKRNVAILAGNANKQKKPQATLGQSISFFLYVAKEPCVTMLMYNLSEYSSKIFEAENALEGKHLKYSFSSSFIFLKINYSQWEWRYCEIDSHAQSLSKRH